MNPDRAVLIVTAICSLLAPPSHADTLIIDGREWTEYTDARDAPESCGESGIFYSACTDASKRRIDYRSPVPAWVKKHERAHAKDKMTHSPYSRGFDNSMCATVWQPGGGYNTGDTICSTASGEITIPSTLFAEAK